MHATTVLQTSQSGIAFPRSDLSIYSQSLSRITSISENEKIKPSGLLKRRGEYNNNLSERVRTDKNKSDLICNRILPTFLC